MSREGFIEIIVNLRAIYMKEKPEAVAQWVRTEKAFGVGAFFYLLNHLCFLIYLSNCLQKYQDPLVNFFNIFE